MFRIIVAEIRCWCDKVVQVLPGAVGNRLRRLWLRHWFLACDHVQICVGCEFIGPETISLGNNVRIGHNAFFCASGGRIDVGANSAFNANVHINASVGGVISIGKWCLFGPNVVLRTANHRFEDVDVPIAQQGHSFGDIRIGSDVWIGSNVVILGGVEIGDGVIIGAGAVVTKSIPAFALAVGVPARVVRYRKGSAVNE